MGQGLRRHRHGQRVGGRPGRGDPGPDRRPRRRRGHRGRRPAPDLRPGLLRPRPGRPARPGRRAVTRHAKVELPMIEIFGRGGSHEVELVRRLPAHPGLPDAHRPLPAAAGSTSAGSSARPSRSTGSRRRSTRWSGARCCARSSSSDGAAHRQRRHLRASSRLDGEDFEVDNNIWLVGDDDEVIVVDAAHDHRPIVAGVGARRVVGRGLHPRPQRPHQRRRAAGRGRRGADLAPSRRPDAVGRRLARPGARRASWPTGR